MEPGLGAGLTIDHQRAREGIERSSYGFGMGVSTPTGMLSSLPGMSTYWDHPYQHPHDDGGGISPDTHSPIDPTAIQFALPPGIDQHEPLGPSQRMRSSSTPYTPPNPYYEEAPDTDSMESDRVPLKPSAQPIGTLEPPDNEAQGRDSFHTVSDMGNSPSRPRNTQLLGFDLENQYFASGRHQSYGHSLTPESSRRRSRSPSTSGALSRAGSIMRAMSQRVVAISGESDLLEQERRERERSRSRSPSVDGRLSNLSGPAMVDTSYQSQVFPGTPVEKHGDRESVQPQEPAPFLFRPPAPFSNPLKGKSLGIFGPENEIRKRLCDLLVNPVTEPLILILIMLQAVLLAVEAKDDVFQPGNERPNTWGKTRIDWALFGLFVVFTVELIAKIIVSGLIANAREYSAVDHEKGVRERMAERYHKIFQPQRSRSVKKPPHEQFTPTFARSFTMMQGQVVPGTLEDQTRLQLARRAFLRHSFNRLDFVAVLSFWIAFILGVTRSEKQHHLYVFRMLSCLRILRLLALTRGNGVSWLSPLSGLVSFGTTQ